MTVSLLRRFRRTVGLGLATLMAVSSLLVCLPQTVEASAAHCPKSAPDHCDRSAVLTCCDAPEPGSTSLPGSLPATDSDHAKASAGLNAVCAFAAAVRDQACDPTHLAGSGSPPLDLVTLHAVFRI